MGSRAFYKQDTRPPCLGLSARDFFSDTLEPKILTELYTKHARHVRFYRMNSLVDRYTSFFFFPSTQTRSTIFDPQKLFDFLSTFQFSFFICV